jgi:hypothetical protein
MSITVKSIIQQGAPIKHMCKIFIKKTFIWAPGTDIILNDRNIIKSLNKDLYKAVQKEGINGYVYSQSYWDSNDKSIVFTDSYWTDRNGWEKWMKSQKRQSILENYRKYFNVDTTYNYLLEREPFDMPLL